VTRIDQSQLYQTQISLTEWFENLAHAKTESLRLEDNDKRERLKVLNKIIGLPFDKPTQFPAAELAALTPRFKKFLKTRGHELCALRLIPADPALPKLRMRGLTVRKAMKWFKEQNINPEFYKADFVPHGDKQKQSTIFIVNKHGIFGEIIKGGHYQLTQGFYDQGRPIIFAFDFKKLQLSEPNPEFGKYLIKLFKLLKVDYPEKRKILQKQLKAKFYKNFLAGYYETVDTEEYGLWFTDYNRILETLYQDFFPAFRSGNKAAKTIKGQVASHGKATGKVRIISIQELATADLAENEILVCEMTTPDYVPLMKKALAIVTDLGGILSHAAIISRELGKPCLTATGKATKILKTGDLIEVDTTKATVTILESRTSF
jgi:phosphohistidine swiveling domain-containing protein